MKSDYKARINSISSQFRAGNASIAKDILVDFWNRLSFEDIDFYEFAGNDVIGFICLKHDFRKNHFIFDSSRASYDKKAILAYLERLQKLKQCYAEAEDYNKAAQAKNWISNIDFKIIPAYKDIKLYERWHVSDKTFKFSVDSDDVPEKEFVCKQLGLGSHDGFNYPTDTYLVFQPLGINKVVVHHCQDYLNCQDAKVDSTVYWEKT